MFLGHFGVALAAKKVAPGVSLGTTILAAEFLDALAYTGLAGYAMVAWGWRIDRHRRPAGAAS
jgi:hypothetical protein